MSQEVLIQLVRDTVMLVFLTAAPLLGAALVMGLLISIFQVVTSIQDMTLTFIPKMVVICLVTLLLLPWIVERIVTFTVSILGHFSAYAG
ncbi:MAG: flagellar biosynthetic protein FliQ [Acidobacteriota bacterium]